MNNDLHVRLGWIGLAGEFAQSTKRHGLLSFYCILFVLMFMLINKRVLMNGDNDSFCYLRLLLNWTFKNRIPVMATVIL